LSLDDKNTERGSINSLVHGAVPTTDYDPEWLDTRTIAETATDDTALNEVKFLKTLLIMMILVQSLYGILVKTWK
jgi:hypothetical protein